MRDISRRLRATPRLKGGLPSCYADGVQAHHRRIKDLAAAQRHKSFAEAHRRGQIQRPHRGHPNAGEPGRRSPCRHSKFRIAHSRTSGTRALAIELRGKREFSPERAKRCIDRRTSATAPNLLLGLSAQGLQNDSRGIVSLQYAKDTGVQVTVRAIPKSAYGEDALFKVRARQVSSGIPMSRLLEAL